MCEGKNVKLLCMEYNRNGFMGGALLSTICIECDRIVNTSIIADSDKLRDIAVDHMHMSTVFKPDLALVKIYGEPSLARAVMSSFVEAAKNEDSGVIVEVSEYVQ